MKRKKIIPFSLLVLGSGVVASQDYIIALGIGLMLVSFAMYIESYK
jgi:hypothetical protein